MANSLGEIITQSGTYPVSVVLGANRTDFDHASTKSNIKIFVTAKDARAANAEVKSIIAAQAGCYPGDVTITSGISSTFKKVYVSKR